MTKLIGHTEVWHYLTHAAEQGKLGHAYMLLGPQHIGKTSLVKYFVAWLWCQHKTNNSPCGVCVSCRQVFSGSHPDLHWIVPVGEASEVTIDQVRNLISFSRLTAQAGWRVMVIEQAEHMNREAGNALLKVLEEPAPGVLIFLLATMPQAVLPTVRSRCTALYLGLVSGQTIFDHLVAQGIDQATAEHYMKLAAGKPGMAFEFVQDPARVTLKLDAARALAGIVSHQGWAVVQALLAAWEAADEKSNRSQALTVVAEWEVVVRDTIFSYLGLPKYILYQAEADALHLRLGAGGLPKALQAAALVQELKLKLKQNAHVRLAFEYFCLKAKQL